MEMKLDPELVRRKRTKRAWSQQHLADVTGLGLRTIQRIEATGFASYESAQSVAACLEVNVAELRNHGSPRKNDGRNLIFRIVGTPATHVIDAYRFRGRLHRMPFFIIIAFLFLLFPSVQKLLIQGWIDSGRSLADIVTACTDACCAGFS